MASKIGVDSRLDFRVLAQSTVNWLDELTHTLRLELASAGSKAHRLR
jgi:hypothetical protein